MKAGRGGSDKGIDLSMTNEKTLGKSLHFINMGLLIVKIELGLAFICIMVIITRSSTEATLNTNGRAHYLVPGQAMAVGWSFSCAQGSRDYALGQGHKDVSRC